MGAYGFNDTKDKVRMLEQDELYECFSDITSCLNNISSIFDIISEINPQLVSQENVNALNTSINKYKAWIDTIF